MVIKRRIYGVFLLFCLLFAALFLLPAAAEEASGEFAVESGVEGTAGEALDSFRGSLPPEVAELLPEGFFSEDPVEMGEAITAGVDATAVIGQILTLLGLNLKENLVLLAALVGIVVLSALLRAVAEPLGEDAGRAFRFCGILAVTLLVFRVSLDAVPVLTTYFSTVRTVSASMVPLMGTLLALGGNVRAAVANHAVMTVYLSIAEVLCSSMILPVSGTCLALALGDAVGGGARLAPLGRLIKRSFTLGLSFLMLLLCFLLGLQTTLAAGADTLALRTLRFAAGSFLPIVGGTVSEALKTVSGSLGYLRTLAGTGGILVLFSLFLPMFLAILVKRLVFTLAGTAAELLGAAGEAKLLSEFASVCGYLLAVIATLFVMTVFALSLFAHCATAGG